MKNLGILFLACLFSFNNANASDWEKVAISKDKKYIYYLDKDSIRNSTYSVIGDYSSKFITSFVQITNTKGTPERIKYKIYYTKQQWVINCNDYSRAVVAIYDYNLSDTVINSWNFNRSMLSKSNFYVTPPDSVGEALIDSACKSAY